MRSENADEAGRPGDEEAFSVGVSRPDARVALVAVRGQADLHTAPELRASITNAIDEGARVVVVDLSETTFIDSMTLGVLLGAVKRLRPSGGSVSVVCSDPHIRRVFEITLLDRVFALYPDREAALAAVDGSA